MAHNPFDNQEYPKFDPDKILKGGSENKPPEDIQPNDDQYPWLKNISKRFQQEQPRSISFTKDMLLAFLNDLFDAQLRITYENFAIIAYGKLLDELKKSEIDINIIKVASERLDIPVAALRKAIGLSLSHKGIYIVKLLVDPQLAVTVCTKDGRYVIDVDDTAELEAQAWPIIPSSSTIKHITNMAYNQAMEIEDTVSKLRYLGVDGVTVANKWAAQASANQSVGNEFKANLNEVIASIIESLKPHEPKYAERKQVPMQKAPPPTPFKETTQFAFKKAKEATLKIFRIIQDLEQHPESDKELMSVDRYGYTQKFEFQPTHLRRALSKLKSILDERKIAQTEMRKAIDFGIATALKISKPNVSYQKFLIISDHIRKLAGYGKTNWLELIKNPQQVEPLPPPTVSHIDDIKDKSEAPNPKDVISAYIHANYELGERWPEAEPYIMQDPLYAYLYSKNVMKKRWPEAEPYIQQSPKFWEEYRQLWKIE